VSKYCFLLTGSNAAGKTTAIRNVLIDWEDDPRIENIRADNDSRFKSDAVEQRSVLTDIWLGPKQVLLIEGTRINTPLMDVAKKAKAHFNNESPGVEFRELVVLMVTQKPDVMKQHLIDRCAKRNKKFRADYWTLQKLEYEGSKRYPNSFRKNGIKAIEYRMGLDYAEQATIVMYLRDRLAEILGEPQVVGR